MSLPPVEIPLGAMRFNSDSQKLEYFNGEIWMQIHTFVAAPIAGRGIAAGGEGPVNTMNYVSIETGGQTLDFGDLTQSRGYMGGCASTTRGLFGGGQTPTIVDTIDYITIATAGDAADFGDLAVVKNQVGSTSSLVRGLWWDGAPSHQNSINYVQFSSTGNAADFGDDDVSRDALFGGIQSSTRGVMSGGNNSGTRQDVQSYITMASTGNAVDFGNLGRGASRTYGAFSNGHGGL